MMRAHPNLTLVGPMASGKSAVGRALAALSGRRFVDTDRLVEEKTGLPVAQFFVRHGEERFRALEAEVIAELPKHQGLIVATGGGALLRPENRAHLEAGGLVLCLWAEPEVLLERALKQGGRPLLAGGDAGTRLLQIVTERKPLYDRYPKLETGALTPEAVALEALRWWEGGGDEA